MSSNNVEDNFLNWADYESTHQATLVSVFNMNFAVIWNIMSVFGKMVVEFENYASVLTF